MVMAMGAEAVESAGDDTGQAHCLNCRTALAGDFCHRCGQPARVHRTAGAVWHDIAHGVLHFEGKVWRTLPMLIRRPGELTRRYIEGERARFVSPLVLFLFTIFLMFAAFNLVGREAFKARGVPPRAAAQAQAKEDAGPVDIDLRGAPGPLGRFDSAYRRAKANPKLLTYKLQSNAYKFSWVTIPLAVPFVWLLFLHRRRYRAHGLYDHSVFATYALSFLGLFALFYMMLKLMGMYGQVALLPFLIPIVHTYFHLKGAYRLSRSSALWRTAALVAFAIAAGWIYFLLLLALGVLG
jgi:hypothetical protein